jgi:hypothetical protein
MKAFGLLWLFTLMFYLHEPPPTHPAMFDFLINWFKGNLDGIDTGFYMTNGFLIVPFGACVVWVGDLLASFITQHVGSVLVRSTTFSPPIESFWKKYLGWCPLLLRWVITVSLSAITMPMIRFFELGLPAEGELWKLMVKSLALFLSPVILVQIGVILRLVLGIKEGVVLPKSSLRMFIYEAFSFLGIGLFVCMALFILVLLFGSLYLSLSWSSIEEVLLSLGMIGIGVPYSVGLLTFLASLVPTEDIEFVRTYI